jgi:hypothetical protein
VHVCQSWRQVIFESPHRLDLQIRCTHGTPVKQHLDLGIWPAFPIVIDYYRVKVSFRDERKRHCCTRAPRSCIFFYTSKALQIWLGAGKYSHSDAGAISAVDLSRHFYEGCGDNIPVLPAEFLGGSAPRLQEITLYGIPYPTLPTLLVDH